MLPGRVSHGDFSTQGHQISVDLFQITSFFAASREWVILLNEVFANVMCIVSSYALVTPADGVKFTPLADAKRGRYRCRWLARSHSWGYDAKKIARYTL